MTFRRKQQKIPVPNKSRHGLPVRGISWEAASGSELDENPLVNKGYHLRGRGAENEQKFIGF